MGYVIFLLWHSLSLPYNYFEITEDKVEKLISQLKPSKSRGPDNFHSKLIKETAKELKKNLTITFKKSVDEGSIPEILEKSNVTAIFKKRRREKSRELSTD